MLWIFHNCVAHPLLGLFPCRWTVWLHDITAPDLDQIVDLLEWAGKEKSE